MARAIDYLSSIGIEEVGLYEQSLTQYATARLTEINGVKIFGTAADKGPVISFLVKDIHHLDMGTLLDRYGIAVRTGHHCAEPLMKRMGIEGTVRASFSFYNTKEEIDILCNAIDKIIQMF